MRDDLSISQLSRRSWNCIGEYLYFCNKLLNFYKRFCNVGGRWEGGGIERGRAALAGQKPYS